MARTAQLKRYVVECRLFRNRLAGKLREAEIPSGPLRLPDYSKSWRRCDLVQDLNDLAVVCRTYKTELEEAGFDMSLAQKASDDSQRLSIFIAETILDRGSVATFLRRRNALCQEMLTLIYGICNLARSVFYKDPRIQNYFCSKSSF